MVSPVSIIWINSLYHKTSDLSEAETERAEFILKGKLLARSARKSPGQRIADAVMPLVPAKLREARAARQLDRHFAAECSRLAALSPHLLDDIGVEVVAVDQTETVRVKVNTLPQPALAASVQNHLQDFPPTFEKAWPAEVSACPSGAQPDQLKTSRRISDALV